MKLPRNLMYVFSICPTLLLLTTSDLAHSKSNLDGRPSPIVQFKDHALTVKVRNMSLETVLREIADQALIKIVFFGPAEELVSADFNNIPLDEGIKRLTRDTNYVFIHGPENKQGVGTEIREVIIYPKTGTRRTRGVEPTIISPEQQTPEELKEAFLIPLLRALEDKDPVVRESVIILLSEFKEERVLEHLAEILLNDADEDVRASAAKALGDIGDEKAIEPLARALQDKEPWVREKAAEALGKIGGEDVIPPLTEILKNKNEDVRDAANEALEKVKKRIRTSSNP